MLPDPKGIDSTPLSEMDVADVVKPKFSAQESRASAMKIIILARLSFLRFTLLPS